MRAADAQSKFRADVFRLLKVPSSQPSTFLHQTKADSCVKRMQTCFSLKSDKTYISESAPKTMKRLATHAGICLLFGGCVVFFFSMSDGNLICYETEQVFF